MKIITILFLLFLSILVGGCSQPNTEPPELPFKVGVTAGPQTEVMYAAKEIAERQGWDFEIIEFGDYDKPNSFLRNGDIDANCFQNSLYLNRVLRDRQYEFTAVAKMILHPMGLYSKWRGKLAEIPQGATIALPDDAGNLSRSLTLLQRLGFITLKPANQQANPLDNIMENPRQFKFQLVDMSKTPQYIHTADIVAINANYADLHQLSPLKDALILEATDSPYTSLLVIRTSDLNRPEVARLIAAYHSPELKAFIERRFQGTVLPAW